MKKILFIVLFSLNLSICSEASTLSYSDFDSGATLITFEGLPDRDLVILDDQYSNLGVRFHSMRSYRLSPHAPGVDALSGVRTASPDDDLSPSGYRYSPKISFNIPVYSVGLYLTDGIDLNWLFDFSIHRSDESVIDEITVNSNGRPSNGGTPLFIGLGADEQISFIKLRLHDPINGNPPDYATNDFEIDNLIFSSFLPIPEPSTFFLFAVGLACIVKFQRDKP